MLAVHLYEKEFISTDLKSVNHYTIIPLSTSTTLLRAVAKNVVVSKSRGQRTVKWAQPHSCQLPLLQTAALPQYNSSLDPRERSSRQTCSSLGGGENEINGLPDSLLGFKLLLSELIYWWLLWACIPGPKQISWAGEADRLGMQVADRWCPRRHDGKRYCRWSDVESRQVPEPCLAFN
jgi:hypothetical protein